VTGVAATIGETAAAAAIDVELLEIFSCLYLSKSLDCDKSNKRAGLSACILRGSSTSTTFFFCGVLIPAPLATPPLLVTPPPPVNTDDDEFFRGSSSNSRLLPNEGFFGAFKLGFERLLGGKGAAVAGVIVFLGGAGPSV